MDDADPNRQGRWILANSALQEKLAREIEGHCAGELRLDESLSEHTALGIGGPADLFLLPADAEDLATALSCVRDSGLPVLPLGGGTNLAVREAGFRGMVVCLTPGLTEVETDTESSVRAQAGASLQVLSRRCRRAGLTGMEFGCGIPGTVGGAIRGNAGAWGGDTMDRLVWLCGTDVETGKVLKLEQSEIRYGYRRTELPEGLIVMDGVFRVRPDDPAAVKGRMDEMHASRKATQPQAARSAGCTFRNPGGESAGKLIDEAGCKGLSAGGMVVSDTHANFIVNRGSGTATDLLALVERVRERVRQMGGPELELEIRILGEGGLEAH